MKKLAGLTVNEKTQDVIIDYWMKEKRDEKGNIIYADEKINLAKCQAKSDEILLYLKSDDNLSKIEAIRINVLSLKVLMKIINEIEEIESDEFIDY